MYYNDYEDYMRSVLGYSSTNDNTYCNSCNYGINYNDMDYNNYRNSATNIEHMYPEIYRIINPMVCRMCDNNNQPVTEYLIERMTDEIYDNVVNRAEIQNVINLNISTRDGNKELIESAVENRGEVKENRSSISKNSNTLNLSNKTNSNCTTNLKQNDLINTNNRSIESDERETRSPQPRRRNRLLRDLIRILILNRIIRPGRPRPNRPPFGPRPTMPGGSGFGPRPPMPRYDDYEW